MVALVVIKRLRCRNMVFLDISHWLDAVIEHKWNVFDVILSTIYFYTVSKFVKITFGLAHNTANIDTTKHLFHAHIIWRVCVSSMKTSATIFSNVPTCTIFRYNQGANIVSRSKWAIFMGLFFSLCVSLFRRARNLAAAYYMVLILNDP